MLALALTRTLLCTCQFAHHRFFSLNDRDVELPERYRHPNRSSIAIFSISHQISVTIQRNYRSQRNLQREKKIEKSQKSLQAVCRCASESKRTLTSSTAIVAVGCSGGRTHATTTWHQMRSLSPMRCWPRSNRGRRHNACRHTPAPPAARTGRGLCGGRGMGWRGYGGGVEARRLTIWACGYTHQIFRSTNTTLMRPACAAGGAKGGDEGGQSWKERECYAEGNKYYAGCTECCARCNKGCYGW